MLRNLIIAAGVCGLMASTGLMGGTFSDMSSASIQPGAASAPGQAKPADPMAPRPVKKNVVAYSTADAGMNAAKAKARATLPRFLDLIAAGAPGTHTVKYPLKQGGQTEHIWVQVSGMKGGKFQGRIANKPVNPGPLAMGDHVEVARAEVEDWMINTGSEIYGGYTARYAMKDMPKAQAEKFKAMFRD